MTGRVIVDTNLWVAFLRRTTVTETIRPLIADDRVLVIGPIAREVFAGLVYPNQIPAASRVLSAARWIDTSLADWTLATEVRTSLTSGPLTSRAGRRSLPSLTDCVLTVIAERTGPAVWSSDTEDIQRAISGLGRSVAIFEP